MIRLLLLLLITLPAGASAQGVITGRVVDGAGGSEYLDEPALAGIVALPESAPPFNEVTAMQWQDAFTAFSNNEEPLTPLGGVINSIEIVASRFAAVEGDGTFRLEDVPQGVRLGVAVKVGNWWWAHPQELKLSETTPDADIEVTYYRLGADAASIVIERHYLESQGAVRDDLQYSPIQIIESIRFRNTDPTRAGMTNLELPLGVPPTMSAKQLPSMYGSQLMYMQGWNAVPPVEREFNATAQMAWSFGVGGGMHGGKPAPQSEPQYSADNWHFLNRDPMLGMVTGGETLYGVTPSHNGKTATLIFRRPVPPASEKGAGILEIRILHNDGVLHLDPTARVALRRSFAYDVQSAEAKISGGLVLNALVEGAHRRYYGPAQDGRVTSFPSNPDASPVLSANEQASIVFGFDQQAQTLMKAIESGEPLAPRPETVEPEGKALDRSMVFKALALVFGLAFVGALVATVRKPRDEQLERLSKLSSSRAEFLDALIELESDYDKRAIPARVYKEERQRMLNRLVEFDARANEAPEDE